MQKTDSQYVSDICSRLDITNTWNLEGITAEGAIKVGISNARALMSNWQSGGGDYSEITSHLSDFKSHIQSEAVSHGNMNVYFLVAIIAVESNGNPVIDGGGMGQVDGTSGNSSYESCKQQVTDAANALWAKARALGMSFSDANAQQNVALAYNSGQALLLGEYGNNTSDGAYKTRKFKDILGTIKGYCKEKGFIAQVKASYWPKVAAAMAVLIDAEFLGTLSEVSNIQTKRDFETNSETDWLLEPSDDERKYGINIYNGQQPLIKHSTASGVSGSDNKAVQALEKYSEFLYYLLNSEVSTAAVQCLSMPWIRPGFNVWYDPLYSDTVYYCMSVTHQGDPHSGARTNLSLVLGRPSSVFINDKNKFGSLKNSSENVLINEMIDKYRVNKFGDTLDTTEEFESVKNATRAYYESESFDTTSAEYSDFHKEFYAKGVGVSPSPDSIDKNKIFSGEYTKEQIESQLNALYENAPSVVRNRIGKLKDVVAKAEEYIETYHLLEHHTN